jgi:hypothetical protein
VKKTIAVIIACSLIALMAALIMPAFVQATGGTTIQYGNVTLTGGYQAGNYTDVWDLTEGDLVLTSTVDLNGMKDLSGTHAWSELGLRNVGAGNFNPVTGSGVWLATDYDYTAGTFAPDPVGAPTLDMDDKLILQRTGGHGEGDYNLPSVPAAPGNNHNFWFDRDGVDQWQALNPLAVNGGNYNTQGKYLVEITMHADNDGSGTAYMKINGLNQGFETDGNWNTMELSPAGMTFTGDMTHMQVFYGLYGYGATHSVTFEDITVTGVMFHTLNFLPPINNDGSSIFKKGSTVPVKFELKDANGNFVSTAVASITVAKLSNGIYGDETEAVSTCAATTGNLFRCADSQYIFNLATKDLSSGTWRITVTLDDGTSYPVIISLK